MKKVIFTLFTIIFIIVTIIYINYSLRQQYYKNIVKENKEFEQYKDKEIYGLELATLINKTIDRNTKNINTEDYTALKIEIYMKDNKETYDIETFYNAGMDKFIKYYKNIKFKCSKIEYNKSTKRIEYMMFEQM